MGCSMFIPKKPTDIINEWFTVRNPMAPDHNTLWPMAARQNGKGRKIFQQYNGSTIGHDKRKD